MIVVTGVHRSGTSAVSMTLESLGLDFGDHAEFYGADRWNERGYFERRDVIDLNSRLLTGFPRTRDPVSSIMSQIRYLALPSPQAVERRAHRMTEDIAELARRLEGLAVKDPRFCLTLPAWQEFVTATVVCLRHPMAVAKSLRRRQRVPIPLALRFWNHHAERLLVAPLSRAIYVDFDALSSHGRFTELARLLAALDLDLQLGEAVEILERHFVPKMRHFEASPAAELPPRSRDLWDALQERRGM